MDKQTWIILGAQSSMARAFAHAVAKQGFDVILVGRDQAELTRSAKDISLRYNVEAHVVLFDATQFEAQEHFIAECHTLQKGKLNLFVAIGFMPTQTEMEQDTNLLELSIRTNYTSLVMLLNRFIPQFEEQKAGHIVVVGSVAGDRGRFSNYAYGSAKAGLHAYLQGLRARLFRAGVTVTTIKPGFIDTAMTYGLPGVLLAATPDACAAACLRATQKGKATYYFPWFWRYIMLIIKMIPEQIFKKLKI